ncbi:hypothetical protein F5887DRAFT_1191767 [Amanita rubescens]|nr:hypothetical protein F5887DRAFT_448387 [Amanita rubescens]KAF8345327.1 hypothetical protein F5887DRAFT_1191767 [Amanita rubescens]
MEDDVSDREWEHPDWRREVDVVEDAGLDFADFDVIRNWVVKLAFFQGKNKNYGSGFFLNLPDVKDKHVILTAAHNLSTPDGTRMTDVVVIYNNPDVTTCTVAPKDIYVGKNYKVAGSPEEDYGVICIPKSSSSDQRGFGFSMKLAYAKYFEGNVYISGFQFDTPDGCPATSTDPKGCVCHPTWVEYDATTQKGISGSVVWIEYSKTQMAVAIHNNGRKDGHSSRGARLTPELLREIYSWLGSNVLQTGVQLRATEIRKDPTLPKLPSRGLFLSFKGDFGFGRVRLGSGTQFDLMPAQVITAKKGIVLYAMATTNDGKWAMFDPTDRNEVRLIEKVRDACLFKKYKKEPKKEHFRLVVQVDKVDFQLRIEGDSILESDEDVEGSEVSFVPWAGGDKNCFTRFLFE